MSNSLDKDEINYTLSIRESPHQFKDMRKLRTDKEIKKEQRILMKLCVTCKSLWSLLHTDEYGDYDLLQQTHKELATMLNKTVREKRIKLS